jgi:predicted O-methyltransferase YrrM
MIEPAEREFRRIWPSIDSIEGLLVSPSQERWLFKAARSLPDGSVIVEIGSFKGRSTCCLAFGCKGTRKHVFAIDTFEGNSGDFALGAMLSNGAEFNEPFFETFNRNIAKNGLAPYVTPMKGVSKKIGKDWNKAIDLLFIDGSHEYADVLADFETFYPHVVPGGVVAFHDVLPDWPGPFKVWQEIASPVLYDTAHRATLAFGRKQPKVKMRQQSLSRF